jgi:hypothetical protein
VPQTNIRSAYKLGRIAMPFIAAIVGAIVTGLFYWLIWGKGLEYLEHQWRESSNRRRDAKRRSAAIQQQQLAPIRSITDSRDAASVLMVLVAQQRGVLTPEQVGVIEHEMQEQERAITYTERQLIRPS